MERGSSFVVLVPYFLCLCFLTYLSQNLMGMHQKSYLLKGSRIKRRQIASMLSQKRKLHCNLNICLVGEEIQNQAKRHLNGIQRHQVKVLDSLSRVVRFEESNIRNLLTWRVCGKRNRRATLYSAVMNSSKIFSLVRNKILMNCILFHCFLLIKFRCSYKENSRFGGNRTP